MAGGVIGSHWGGACANTRVVTCPGFCAGIFYQRITTAEKADGLLMDVPPQCAVGCDFQTFQTRLNESRQWLRIGVGFRPAVDVDT